jgi:flagellar motor switch protein FliN/FliY
MEMDSASVNVDNTPAPSPTPAAAPQSAPQAAPQPMPAAQPMPMAQPMMGQAVNVQPAQFTAFSNGSFGTYQPENIDLIMDVPLEVTVELGRTSKSISEILDFGPGKIIELNKLAGEPIDVLVNGKNVAKGEVVVIEESFGVRITEIVNAVKAVQT